MIYIIRHAQTLNNKERIVQGQTDTLLSIEGRLDVIKFSNKLKELNIKFDSFYSSPLKRANETLNIIMDNLGYDALNINIDNSLIERYFGIAEGITIDDITINRICNDYYNDMEKNKILEKRVYEGLLKIAKENYNKNVLIVSHSHAIKAFIRNIDKNYSYLDRLDNLGLNIFDFKENKFSIIELNKVL